MAILLAILLLTGLGAETHLLHVPADDVTAYHLLVRKAAEAVPTRVGCWVGVDVPVPAASVALLKPNVVISRRYVNADTGDQAQVLLVQCRDARDMLGHYPPVCYAGQGWTLRSRVETDWQAGATTIAGTTYEFADLGSAGAGHMVVQNVLILPGDHFARDMNGLRRQASHYQRRYLGAGQLQVVLDTDVPLARREAVFGQLAEAFLPLIRTIQKEDSR